MNFNEIKDKLQEQGVNVIGATSWGNETGTKIVYEYDGKNYEYLYLWGDYGSHDETYLITDELKFGDGTSKTNPKGLNFDTFYKKESTPAQFGDVEEDVDELMSDLVVETPLWYFEAGAKKIKDGIKEAFAWREKELEEAKGDDGSIDWDIQLEIADETFLKISKLKNL